MSNRLVRVSRSGKIIGQYPPEQLASLMDSGHFLESDLCWSETSPEWTLLPQFLKKTKAPKYLRAGVSDPATQPTDGYRRSHHSKRRFSTFLSGWIAFLLAMSALIGAGFWISSLSDELGRTRDRMDELEKKLGDKDKENQKLLFSGRELADPGTVKGSVILRNDAGKRNAVPGIPVFLFNRKVIEDYLASREKELNGLQESSNTDLISFFSATLPTSLVVTTTDASGRFTFSVSEPGEYVLFARVNLDAKGSLQPYIWFVSFNSEDPINSAIELNESNHVREFVTSLMIVQGR
jgi:hypothetical protein